MNAAPSRPAAKPPRDPSAAEFVAHVQRITRALELECQPLTPQRIYARLLPRWADWWDANDLPDTWLATNLYLLRRRLAAASRPATPAK